MRARAGAVAVVLVVASCRQLLGIDTPGRAPAAADALRADTQATVDAAIDADLCSGALPAQVSLTFNGGLTTLQVDTISVGGAQNAIVAPDAMVAFSFAYAITDTSCPGECEDQIEIGLVPGGRQACPFDNVVPKGVDTAGSANGMLAAPAAPGEYDVRVNLGQNYSCTYMGASSWWVQQPAADATIARLCVN